MGLESWPVPSIGLNIKGKNMIQYFNCLLQANNMTWVFNMATRRIFAHGTHTLERCATIECAMHNLSGSSSFYVNMEEPSIDVNRRE